MSQVAKSASAFVRAFLAILALELEDMVVRLVRPPKLAGVHGYRWTVRLGISVDVKCPASRLAWRARICPGAEAAKRALDQIKGLPAGIVDPTNLLLAELVYLERAEKLAHKAVTERLVAVVRSKNASPTWTDVRTVLLDFDRAGLRGLVQDLYTASKDNRAFLHARLGLGHDQLQPFKANISTWICPDLMNNQSVSVSKAKKAIADYKKAIGRPEGMAELSIFYCEEAFGFLESCSMEDESYFAALIRMYGRSLEFVSNLPAAERATYRGRLDKLRSRGSHVGWGVQDELNSLWYASALDEQQSE
jgi:hypothetical protein